MAEIAAIQQQLPGDVWDRVTWPDYIALQKFWARWPPTIVLAAIRAGCAPQQRKQESDDESDGHSEEAIAALAQLIGRPPPQE